MNFYMRSVATGLFVYAGLMLAQAASAETVSVCAQGCSQTSLQVALDRAQCGDVIRIRASEPQVGNFKFTYRGCAQNPITVTSDREDWLPPAGGRVTPSHLPNMAVVATHNSQPALMGVLDEQRRPGGGWIFRGIAFTTQLKKAGTYALVDLAGLGYSIQNEQELPENIVIDQCYFFSPLPGETSVSVQNMLRANGRNVTVKNSYFGDGAWPGVETHGIFLLETGPVTIENNFILASSIPIFSGGVPPSYPTVPHQVTVRYNYSFRPWKWNADPEQPFARDYVENGRNFVRWGPVEITNISDQGVMTVPSEPPFYGRVSVVSIVDVQGCPEANRPDWRVKQLTGKTFQLEKFPGCSEPYRSGGAATDYSFQVCTKNLGELKSADTVLWQYNVGENSWFQVQCQSQSTGFTDTTRTSWDNSSGALGKLRFLSNQELQWTGTYQVAGKGACCDNARDLGVCASVPNIGTECRPVAAFDNDRKTLRVATPFQGVSSDPVKGWIIYDASSRLTNLTLTNNVWRNVSQGITFLAYSFSNGVGDAGFGKNHRIENNLWWNSSTYTYSHNFWMGGAGEADFIYDPLNYVFNHNTYFSVTPVRHSFVFASSTQCGDCATKRQPLWDGLVWSNNLVGQGAGVGFGGDGQGGISDTVNAYMKNAEVRNNFLPGAQNRNGCSGSNVCSGNIGDTWADPFVNLLAGDVLLQPGHKLRNAASDGKDIGADPDQLPLITNLQVVAGQTSATLEFDVTAPIQDVRRTQPCALEVSTSRNLHSDLGAYTVIPDLNPVLFRSADSSARTNTALTPVFVSGKHITWVLGSERPDAVTTDSGQQVSLQLIPGTPYYGRLMCYGDTQWFTFRTSSQYRRRALFEKLMTFPDTTTVRVSYSNGEGKLAAKADFTPGPDGMVTIEVPLLESGEVSYQVDLLKGNKPLYKGREQNYRKAD